ncbi:MAG: M14 metallopeptidase family protein [Nannocystaceae bacterium]|nr:M14 family zinc carboxypeptidase [bacterium]
MLASLLLFAAAPHGDALVRVQTPTASDAATVHELGLDVWTEVPQGPWLDVRVKQGQWAQLDVTGLDYEVRVPDLGPQVEAERLRLAGPVAHGGEPDPDAFFGDFADLAQIHARIDELAALHPDIATVIETGESLEGRRLPALRVTRAPEGSPTILLDAGQHAREWIGISSATCVADRLVRRADEPEVAPLLAAMQFVIFPVVNPDGYVHSWEVDRLWRKNRRPPDGVDLNRNFPVVFGGPGASDNPMAGNYHGEAAFSEPESAAVRDLAEDLDPLLAVVDVHSYGQLVLYPWGFTLDPAPADDALSTAAQTLSQGLGAAYGTPYEPIPGAGLYPASGNLMDWAYGDLGAYSYVLEMRPASDVEFPLGFVLPPEDIIPVCDELYDGLLALSEQLADTDPPGAGDDGGAWESTSSSGGSTETGQTTIEPPQGTSSSGGIEGTGAGTTSGSTTAAPRGSEGSSTEAQGADSETSADSGCGCTSSAGGTYWALLGLLLFARRTPRRRAVA